MSDRWNPIDTAPKDRLIDLWIVPPAKLLNAGRRVTGCRWSGYSKSWVQGVENVTGRWGIDDEGNRCCYPQDTSDKAFRATHWMDTPEPPADVIASLRGEMR